MHAGPTAETRTVQRLRRPACSCRSPGDGPSVLSITDSAGRRFRTAVSTWPVDVLVVLGLGIGSLVVIQNGYASANITVEEDQKVVYTGLYGLVRHPMYMGSLIMLVGFPLALSSYWGLVFLIPIAIVLVVRVSDEEKALNQELAGYTDYTQQVHYRLVPGVW